MPEPLGRYGRYFCINKSFLAGHSDQMTMFCNQVLLYFLHCLKRTEHFLYQKNPADTEPCLYELHQELQKTWRFSGAYPNYFTMLGFVLPLSSMDICIHISSQYVRHPTAGFENVIVVSCLALHAFLTVHLFPFLISILVFSSLKMNIMSIYILLDTFTVYNALQRL